MKLKDPFAFYTNFFFLVPLYFAIAFEAQWHAIIIGIVFIFSLLFHFTKPKGPVWWGKTNELETSQKVFLWSDTLLGSILIFYNLFVFWQKGFPILFWYAIGLGVIALYIFLFKTKEREYDFYHGVWHMLSVIITLLAVI